MALGINNLEMKGFCRFAAHVQVEWYSGKNHTDGVKETKASEISLRHYPKALYILLPLA